MKLSGGFLLHTCIPRDATPFGLRLAAVAD